jgi:hypothetical protein
MKTLPWFLLLGVASLAGCATPFRAPPDVAQIKLERANSPVVVVDKIWLERKQGPLVVKGYVVRQLAAEDTTQTHLDVTVYDAAGAILRTSVEHFEPRQIPRRYRPPADATYSIPLDPLPVGTVRIEVRAHEGNHS